jgi:hypothetical protein
MQINQKNNYNLIVATDKYRFPSFRLILLSIDGGRKRKRTKRDETERETERNETKQKEKQNETRRNDQIGKLNLFATNSILLMSAKCSILMLEMNTWRGGREA